MMGAQESKGKVSRFFRQSDARRICHPRAAMLQITDWLVRLGMSECAQRFAENRIDFSILPDLTHQDLEKLCILLGDRRKMPRAIANLEV
jgi:hypothetical protein